MTLKELIQSYRRQREATNVEMEKLAKQMQSEPSEYKREYLGMKRLELMKKSDFFRGVLVDLSELEGVE